ncbi:uncharacterized protein LOC143544626 [Bidens hawaiensis]|uniref:uncharacterized protein LOC143544626 n=1 Tax=Bidens hawaiensis TaxID=980011 RepID=UPI004049C148
MPPNSTTYLNLVHQLNITYHVPKGIISSLSRYVIIIYNSDLEEKYGEPMVLIGIYIAFASLCCILAMVADLIHGLRSRKLWFPCKYFTINAASLSVIAVAMKLPVDLSASMPGVVDQVSKLGSVAFMCTMMANLLPCLATMDSNAMLANIVALGVMVITLVVNVCIQIQTGVVACTYCKVPLMEEDEYHIPEMVANGSYPDSLDVIGGVPYSIIAAIYVTMLLVLLIIYVSSSLAILKSKEIIESKYQEGHARASRFLEQSTEELLTVDRLRQHVKNYWLMAGSGSPQFLIACSPTTTASGVICALTALLHTLTMCLLDFDTYSCGSAYKGTTKLILKVQFVGVLVGSVAPLSRCFASLSFYKVSTKSIWNHMKVFKVECYWTEKLSDWKNGSIPFPFRTHKRKIVINNLKSIILNFFIKLQEGVVVVCKIIALNSFFFTICVLYFLRCLKCLSKATCCSLGKEDYNLDESSYVLQLEEENELAKGTLKGLSKSLNQLIQNSEKKHPENLMKLTNTKSTLGFQGLKMFDKNNDHVQCVPPSNVVYRDCWSLAVVTLATIAVTLREIKKVEVDSLLKSVREGLDYVTLVEKNLNATPDYASSQKAAECLWQEVDVCDIWLGIKLKDIASQVNKSDCLEDPTMQIVHLFLEKAKIKISEPGEGSKDGDSEFTSICANSMARITETIIKDSEKKSFDELISSRIADIMAACLTNLPQVIAMKCHTSAIEKREACVKGAAELLGETTELIKIVQDLSRCVSGMHPDNMPFIDKWHASMSEP